MMRTVNICSIRPQVAGASAPPAALGQVAADGGDRGVHGPGGAPAVRGTSRVMGRYMGRYGTDCTLAVQERRMAAQDVWAARGQYRAGWTRAVRGGCVLGPARRVCSWDGWEGALRAWVCYPSAGPKVLIHINLSSPASFVALFHSWHVLVS